MRNNRAISCGGARYPGQLCAMILTGTDAARFNVSRVSVEGNGGWTRQLYPLAPNVSTAQRRLVRAESFLHTFADAAVPQLPIYRLREAEGATSGAWPRIPGLPGKPPVLHPLAPTILGQKRFAWSNPPAPGQPASGAVVATVPLTAEAHAVAGQGVWFAVRALVNLTGHD